MARYSGPVCRFCRREGLKLFLKGTRCYSDKCAVERRGYPPGQHGRRRSKVSDYGLQLREKQKMRRMYGLLEQQFSIYYDRAAAQKGITGEKLVVLLERRLDNLVYRMKFASSRRQARQLVLHGHFLVNGHPVNIPSYLTGVGAEVQVKESSRSAVAIAQAMASGARQVPEWIEVDSERFSGRLVRLPERTELDLPFREQLVVELYSK